MRDAAASAAGTVAANRSAAGHEPATASFMTKGAPQGAFFHSVACPAQLLRRTKSFIFSSTSVLAQP